MTDDQFLELKAKLQDTEFLMLYVQAEIRVLQYEFQAHMMNAGIPLAMILELKKEALGNAFAEVAKQWPALRSELRKSGDNPPDQPNSRF